MAQIIVQIITMDNGTDNNMGNNNRYDPNNKKSDKTESGNDRKNFLKLYKPD